MDVETFIRRWSRAELTERAAAQSHFNDLCELLGEAKPVEADPEGNWYAFERGARKTIGGRGWADVWKKGHFAWEYKRPGSRLEEAIDQLKTYALALDNPPLLVACDLRRFLVVTNWTNEVSERHAFGLEDLRRPEIRDLLKAVFADPERLRPKFTRAHVTEIVARRLGEIAQDLRARGHDPFRVAHFVNRLVFCMFAEDIGLLPDRPLSRLIDAAAKRPDRFVTMASELFAAMKDGGLWGPLEIPWFDGGLFDDAEALPLAETHIRILREAARQDWSQIDPAIMGTLFERGLDPDKRSQLGAHYTDPEKIEKIVDPVIRRPLEAEWAIAREEIAQLMERARAARAGTARRLGKQAQERYRGFLERLCSFRVLDPACGSGNFLYLALQALKDLEHRAGLEAEAFGLHRELPQVSPAQCLGIEINPFAAELARVSVWIGDIQWMRRHGYDISRNPILRPLETIECRDALLNPDGTPADWPDADVIIGNPPFLGVRLMRGVLGDDYVNRLFRAYTGWVPREADLVCYWFAKAREQMEAGRTRRVGLVATNSIRGGANRKVLDAIADRFRIYEAWSDEPWILEGAAVRVSIVCFARHDDRFAAGPCLDGRPVRVIYTSLSDNFDARRIARLLENRNIAFMGDTKGGPFDIPGELAREWLRAPINPNGRPNSDVLRPWWNGLDVTRRPRDVWIIDFGWTMEEEEAALYELPFEYAVRKIKPARIQRQSRGYAKHWWRHERSRPDMWRSIGDKERYIVTPTVSEHRVFAWLPTIVCPDHQLIVIARDDDVTFGILQSRFNRTWSLATCSWLGAGNDARYTPTTTFETFPFPDGLEPNRDPAGFAEDPRARRIADAARRLDELRRNWLNPPDLVVVEPEVVPGYPDRVLPRDEKAAQELKKRTLTKLYNDMPAWLRDAHAELDAGVAEAYGWHDDPDDREVLSRLFELNLERAAGGRAAAEPAPHPG